MGLHSLAAARGYCDFANSSAQFFFSIFSGNFISSSSFSSSFQPQSQATPLNAHPQRLTAHRQSWPAVAAPPGVAARHGQGQEEGDGCQKGKKGSEPILVKTPASAIVDGQLPPLTSRPPGRKSGPSGQQRGEEGQDQGGPGRGQRRRGGGRPRGCPGRVPPPARAVPNNHRVGLRRPPPPTDRIHPAGLASRRPQPVDVWGRVFQRLRCPVLQ